MGAVVAVWIAERAWRIEGTYLGTERSEVHNAVVDDTRDARIIENPGASTQTGLAVSEYVVSKADPWRKILEVGLHAVFDEALIPGEGQSRRSVRELG